jgi:hypothetical protein
MAKNISKQVADILKGGTPKQKAVLICQNLIDRETRQLKPLLTQEEANAIRKSFLTQEEGREFNKWISVYNTYSAIISHIGLFYAEYKANVNALLVYIQQWEDYCKMENQLNTLIEEFKEKGNEDAIKTIHDSLKYLYLPYAKVKLDKDGYIVISIGAPKNETGLLYDYILMGRRKAQQFLMTLKAWVEVVEEWTKRVKGKALMPPPLADLIEQAKGDYAMYVAPAYSEHQYNKRIAKGEKVSLIEKSKAVFPDYEKIEVPTEIHDTLEEKIANIYKSEKL